MPRFPLSVGLLSCLLLLVGLGGCAHVANETRLSTPQSFAHEGSDLKPDPAIKWGRLPNGLRYAILPHATPKQRASVQMLVQAGSMHERDSELGYAHIVEHLAFRDLRGVPGGVFATLEKLGAAPHSAANTTALRTAYYFHGLPTTDRETLPAAFKLMRGIVDGIIFTSTAVAQERAVVLSELRLRSAPGFYRGIRDDLLEFAPPRENEAPWNEIMALFPDSILPQRQPIGTAESIEAAAPAKLQEFYKRWYRPERVILVVVGDIDPVEIEGHIIADFGSLAGRGRSPQEPVLADPGNPPRIQGFPNSIDPTISFSMGVVRVAQGRDTVAARERALAQRVSLEMLERRLERTSEADDAPLLSSSAFVSHLVPGFELPLVHGEAKPATWRAATEVIDYEVRRILAQGFTPAELQSTTREERLRVAASARQAGLRDSASIANALADSIMYRIVFTSLADDRALAERQLAQLSPERCHEIFRELLGAGAWSLTVSGAIASEMGNLGGELFGASRAAELKPYLPPEPPAPFPYTDFGAPGKVVKNERFEAINTQMLQFANGVRLNLKQTTFEPGRARLDIRLEGGFATTPPGRSILAWRAGIWLTGGLAGMTLDEERSALIEIRGSYDTRVLPTAISFVAANEALHLPLMLQAVAAYMTQPAFRPTVFARGEESTRGMLQHIKGNAMAAASWRLAQRMVPEFPSFHVPELEDLRTNDLANLKNWLIPQLASAPIEVGIIGDFDPPTVIDAVARTLGALPRRASFESLDAGRQVTFPAEPFAETMVIKSDSDTAIISMAWPVLDTSRYPAHFHAHLAANILEQRLWQKIRQEMGASYVVKGQFFTEETLAPKVAYLHCTIDAAANRVEAIAAAVREVEVSLRLNGATAEELERARRPLIRSTETGLSHNGWWLDVVTFAQRDPEYARGWMGAKATYETATLEEINAALRRWLDAGRRSEVIVKPEK